MVLFWGGEGIWTLDVSIENTLNCQLSCRVLGINHNFLIMLLFGGFYAKGIPYFYSLVLVYHNLEIIIFSSSGVKASWRTCIHVLGCHGKDKTWDKLSIVGKYKFMFVRPSFSIKLGICVENLPIFEIRMTWIKMNIETGWKAAFPHEIFPIK